MTPDRRRLVAWLLLTIALAFSVLAGAEPAPEAGVEPGANLEVALYTFGPGEEVWERFGHNAIEIRDRSSGMALLYNYGIFDFAQENFFLNFARGLMTYRIAAGDPADELPVYVAEGRWVVRQQLALSPTQREKLATFLAWNAREENERAWRVPAETILANGCNLDLKNPRAKQDAAHLPPEELVASILEKERRIAEIMSEVQALLAQGARL